MVSRFEARRILGKTPFFMRNPKKARSTLSTLLVSSPETYAKAVGASPLWVLIALRKTVGDETITSPGRAPMKEPL